jgi:hypothetical protein
MALKDDSKVILSILIDRELMREFRIACIDNGIKMSAMLAPKVSKMINLWLEANKKDRENG